jgi:hypothetical protein
MPWPGPTKALDARPGSSALQQRTASLYIAPHQTTRRRGEWRDGGLLPRGNGAHVRGRGFAQSYDPGPSPVGSPCRFSRSTRGCVDGRQGTWLEKRRQQQRRSKHEGRSQNRGGVCGPAWFLISCARMVGSGLERYLLCDNSSGVTASWLPGPRSPGSPCRNARVVRGTPATDSASRSVPPASLNTKSPLPIVTS